jgi:hemerythrin-like domain-containing protein
MQTLLQDFFMKINRRQLLAGIGSLNAALLLNGCSEVNKASHTEKLSSAQQAEEPGGSEVTAVEDLMREHGILRRALFVYSESAMKMRNDLAVSPDALHKTAVLFRDFGEDYHEKKLEEAYIFPAVKKAGGPAAGYPDILIAQNNSGRLITDYIIAVTGKGKFDISDGRQLAIAIDSLVRMYRPHAAREDTIVFPAWKQALTPKQLDEMGDKFEEIEHQQFGEDGFEDAVRQIAAIENTLGMADLAQFTALPPPPKT